MRVGLVGCVKTKQERAAPARDLYTSPLFQGRRAFVEASCDRWYILSAKHGLVDPDDLLEPYDETLVGEPVSTKRAWARRVLGELDRLVRTDYPATVFEVHAGADYRDFGLVAGLEVRGAKVEIPAEHLGQGEQLAMYAGRTAPARPVVGAASPRSRPRPSGGGRSSYAPLGEHLRNAGRPVVHLSFAEIEAILGRLLPASARKHQVWWANESSGTHTHARVWMQAGWVAENANLHDETVTFRRVRP